MEDGRKAVTYSATERNGDVGVVSIARPEKEAQGNAMSLCFWGVRLTGCLRRAGELG